MVKTLYYENISPELYNYASSFIDSHPNALVSYHDWRESLDIRNKIYSEAAESTKKYGEEVDAILEKYKDKDMMFYQNTINAELSKIGVVENPNVNHLLGELAKYHY